MNKKLGFVSLILAVILLLAGCSGTQNIPQETTQSQTPVGNAPQEQSEVEVQRENGDLTEEQIQKQSLQNAIADGTYQERVTYSAPPGQETVDIEITFEDDVVTQLTITGVDMHPTSENYRQRSESGLQELLVGKKISEVDVPTRISGSSLTTGAFKKKLDELIEEY